jgi:hypothetical protein
MHGVYDYGQATNRQKGYRISVIHGWPHNCILTHALCPPVSTCTNFKLPIQCIITSTCVEIVNYDERLADDAHRPTRTFLNNYSRPDFRCILWATGESRTPTSGVFNSDEILIVIQHQLEIGVITICRRSQRTANVAESAERRVVLFSIEILPTNCHVRFPRSNELITNYIFGHQQLTE